MSISAGDQIPSAPLAVMGSNGPGPVDSSELLGSGLVVLFAVPGAFTPTCSAEHLPGFVEHAKALREKGVDRIVCMAVNDVFVMDAWGKAGNVGDDITMAADGNGEFTRALGLEMDASAFGMGQRCHRFAMIVRDGVVAKLLVEGPGEFRVSSAEYVLEQI
ncbi:peroxiredoxin [Wenzhouxiangella limi]|uniref:Glutathione-dependent peroxiredoxin n=1 Tax=Wenzhouxiangella limi TaxID=2707351 RepID=A0A845V4G6_9GAMM|nr:peroxiredoxin [Wenzhouxiangella limi]NDY94855.1 peroxiredoxin [Wenzhouxiangella limi]